MVVCMEHDEGVLDEGDRDERPEDEAEKAEEVVLGGVLQLHRREHVERRRPEVAVHDPQRLVRQPQRLEPRKLLHARTHARINQQLTDRAPLRGSKWHSHRLICEYMQESRVALRSWSPVSITYLGLAVRHLVGLAEGAARLAGGIGVVVVVFVAGGGGAPLVDGGDGRGAELDHDVVAGCRRLVLVLVLLLHDRAEPRAGHSLRHDGIDNIGEQFVC